jgi:hypothetical protein
MVEAGSDRATGPGGHQARPRPGEACALKASAASLQFRGDRIERETLYFADPFPAPDWRRPWAEEGSAEERQRDLPATVAAGQ